MNYEQSIRRSDKRIVTGKAIGARTLAGAAETLRKLADQLEAISNESTAVLHYAELKWKLHAGESTFGVGRGDVSWVLTTWTDE